VNQKRKPKQEGEAPAQETIELRFLRSVLGASSIPKPELPVYDGNLTR
jgi:hypothetical protein